MIKVKWCLVLLLLSLSMSGCKNHSNEITNKELSNAEKTQTSTDLVMTENKETVEENEDKEKERVGALMDLYKDYFKIGVALNPVTIGQNYKNTILENFNSMTCENEMKPDYIMDKEKSQEGVKGDDSFIAVSFANCEEQIRFCEENNIKMRLHTLVWHAQTPDWFFYENYDTQQKLSDAETMKKKMKNYIDKVIYYFDTEHPNLIYSIDVVNEAFNGEGTYKIKENENLWYDTIGYDYLYYAFLYTREAVDASKNMKNVTLAYNDYAMMHKVDTVSKGLEMIFAEHDSNVHKYVDVIGFQSHLDITTKMGDFAKAVRSFCEMGYEVQITELDIGIPNIKVGENPDEKDLFTQGAKYRSLMERMMALVDEGYKISSVTVWGISDENSWRKADKGFDAHALLWGKDMEEKSALRGMALADDITSYYTYGLDN